MSDERPRMIAVSTLQRCFADDRVGHCARCLRLVYYRPHTPPVDERICVECFEPAADQEWITTRESVRELALYLSAKGRPQ